MNKFYKHMLDLNKEGVTEQAAIMVRNVTSGADDPLEMYVAIKKLEAILEIAKKVIHEKAYRDTTIQTGEAETAYGCKIEKVTSGTTYAWKEVQDPEYWKRKNDLKEREDFLKGLKSTAMMNEEERARYNLENELEVVDEETGEIITITPVVKTQGSSLKITIK